MGEQLQFRVSSALKDIIGRDLITDDYLAVFELVKNSFDAYAKEVEIIFENIYTDKAKIIIKDNGKGMNFFDLKNKWLFVAYSAKKEGIEDDNFEYRDRIYSNRSFAGAKGIGRFSCDRLGKTLFLETLKDELNPNVEALYTDWEKFEIDSQKEFINISVLHETKEYSSYGISSGTVLEISDLRSKWDRNKILKLKDSLSKLINPYNDENDEFSIFINSPDELKNDEKETDYRKIINGKVKNFIFETLGFKTTHIICSIDQNGKYISSTLVDGGTTIYSIKQYNHFVNLNNININLYYLNRSAKYAFHRYMGMASRLYGNVFLYKNGFRVYPYGEPFSDPMGIEERKSRKYKSRLGTGEIIGRIEIFGKNNEFKETSSRGDGLIKNDSYYKLEDFFFNVLEKLEKYVVDVQKWGLSIEDKKDVSLESRIIDLIAKITNADDIIDFSIPSNFIEILESSQVDSAETVVNNLRKIAIEIGDEKLLGIAGLAIKKVEILQAARVEAEEEAKLAAEKAKKATKKLKDQITENLFLKSINTSDYTEMISLLHHIGIYAGTVDNYLGNISLRVQNQIPLSNDELYEIIKQIGFEIKKIMNISTFATKAKFNLKTEETTIDLVNYIKEYTENIIPSIMGKEMKIQFIDLFKAQFIKKIKPIEINIIIDNLISNARKAKSQNLFIRTRRDSDSSLIVEFEDDGIGIDKENINKIYNIGYTTTDGSGVGLYHVKKIIGEIGYNINVNINALQGVTFKIKIKE